jgi:hypothetical protein
LRLISIFCREGAAIANIEGLTGYPVSLLIFPEIFGKNRAPVHCLYTVSISLGSFLPA